MNSSLIETELGWLVVPDPCVVTSIEDVISEVHYLGLKTGWIVYSYPNDGEATVRVKP